MKTVYKYSYLSLLFLPLFFSQCGNKASEPTPAQVVTIADMWYGNVTDYDGDGFVSFFNLSLRMYRSFILGSNFMSSASISSRLFSKIWFKKSITVKAK